MLSLILRRIGIAIPVLLTVVTLTFLMVHSAPGGPFDEEKAVSPEVLIKLNEKYNLDQPLINQYLVISEKLETQSNENYLFINSRRQPKLK